MVQWMRNREPRYKGTSKIEMERPSQSYIADVRSLSHYSATSSADQDVLDAPADRETAQACRCHSSKTSPFFPEQGPSCGQCRQVDARRSKASHRFIQRRVHALERYGVQLRDHNAGSLDPSKRNERAACSRGAGRHMMLQYGRQYTRTMRIGSSRHVMMVSSNTGNPISIMSKQYKGMMIILYEAWPFHQMTPNL